MVCSVVSFTLFLRVWYFQLVQREPDLCEDLGPPLRGDGVQIFDPMGAQGSLNDIDRRPALLIDLSLPFVWLLALAREGPDGVEERHY